jgi:hypothetical protein
MSVDLSRIDLLLQFALLAAGEEDEFQARTLGPIHLIKYVYLGDLAFAARNGGQTFTGIDWEFYRFGPWSQTVHARIEPALLSIGAEKMAFESDYEDRADWCRWAVSNEDLMGGIEKLVPSSISVKLKPLIHRYGSETAALLDFVYRTPPMLNAAPNEMLDFSLVAAAPPEAPPVSPILRMNTLSAKKKRRFAERMRTLQRAAESRPPSVTQLINPVLNPRYDEVYQDGVAWLEELAGERPPTGDTVAEFADEVWKSTTRKGSDVP